MTNQVNRYLAEMAAPLSNPLAFTSTTGAANVAAALVIVNADLQLLIDAVSYESTDPTYHRLFLDEMSPAARTSLYKMLISMKALMVV